MVKLRNMACVYIFNKDSVLMMKRSKSSRIFPDFWVPVGGHMEPDEINDPLKACLREVYEETGIKENNLKDLELRYITVRRKDNEIRNQYIYFANTTVKTLSDTEEGKLYWIDQSDLLNLKMSVTNKTVLKHYFSNRIDGIMMGVIDVLDSGVEINWTEIKSFDSMY